MATASASHDIGGDEVGKPVLYLDCDMTEADRHAMAGGVAVAVSVRAPGRDGPNEDAGIVIPVSDTSGVIAVADGMGGGAAGHEAARLAVTTLRSVMAKSASPEVMLRTIILNGFEAANDAVRELGIGAATTLAVVEIQDRAIRPYHVGDSEIIVVGGRGKVKHRTISHSPVGYGVESGYLDHGEAIHHEDRHLLSNYIGSESMHIQIGPNIPLAPRDTVLVTSDGLMDNLHLDEIVTGIRKGELRKACIALAKRATQRMVSPKPDEPSKSDDMTFIAFRLAPPRRQKRAAGNRSRESGK